MQTKLFRQGYSSAFLALIGFVCVFLLVQTAQAQLAKVQASLAAQQPTSSPQILGPFSSDHRLQVGAVDLAYTAIFEEKVLRDSQGKPEATIAATSYVRKGVPDVRKRPVLFAFNGGPGASSTPLHFEAFGPRRIIKLDNGGRSLVDNPYTLLSDTDLVFIDPVGTGFTQILPGGSGAPYWSVEGDAAAVLDLIRAWLRENDRLQSPVYIAGESYGGFRLATMLKSAENLDIAGLIFISPLLDASASAGAPGNDLPYVFSLPAMSVAAWEHKRIDRGGRTVEQQFDQAAKFAQTDYLVALQQGSQLSANDRDRIAARMSQLIGLPASDIAATDLRISDDAFVDELLKNQNLVLGRLDTRVAAPPQPRVPKDRPAAANDPSLGLGMTNVIKNDVAKSYFQSELHVPANRDYVSLTLDVNFKWNWQQPEKGWQHSFYTNATPNIADYMKKHPDTRLMMVGGYFDLAVPMLSVRYAINHSQIPLHRVTFAAFASGHSTFSGDAALMRMDQVMRSFLLGK